MNKAELYGKMADLMLERGLTRYAQEDKSGQICVAGAFSIALTGKAYGDVFYKIDQGQRTPTPQWGAFESDWMAKYGLDPVHFNNDIAEDAAEVAERLKLLAEDAALVEAS